MGHQVAEGQAGAIILAFEIVQLRQFCRWQVAGERVIKGQPPGLGQLQQDGGDIKLCSRGDEKRMIPGQIARTDIKRHLVRAAIE